MKLLSNKRYSTHPGAAQLRSHICSLFAFMPHPLMRHSANEMNCAVIIELTWRAAPLVHRRFGTRKLCERDTRCC